MTLVEAYWPLALTIILIGVLNRRRKRIREQPIEDLQASQTENRYHFNERYRPGGWNRRSRRKEEVLVVGGIRRIDW